MADRRINGTGELTGATGLKSGGDPTNMAIYSWSLANLGIGDVPSSRLNLNFNESLRATSLKTTIHEFGHVVNAGEADENGKEIYSGGDNDLTKEFVSDNSRSQPTASWSWMSHGGQVDHYLPPTNASYFALSIEEALTVDTADDVVNP